MLWLIKGLGPGGAEHLLVSTAKGADPDRFRFSVAYLLNWKRTLDEPLRSLGVATTCLDVKDAKDLRWVLRLRQHIKRGNFDVIHVHSPLVAGVTRLVVLTIRRHPPIISSEHNSWASHGRGTRLLNRITFRLDAAHIAVSQQVVDSLPARLRGRVEVIVHGVDTDALTAAAAERDAVRTELGVRPEQIAICTVANLRWQKGYPDLLAAAKTVIDAGHDVVFLAVGQGPLEAELKARHAELGLGDRFRFLGYRSDAVRILAGSDVFALASLHEGYPIAVMEAMVAGLPVVATDAGGVPDAVREGVEGYVAPASNPAALAAALLRVVADPELRARMSKAARARGLNFGIAPAIERTQEIYAAVAARHRG